MELRAAKNHENARKLLNTALDCGINFIDTSQDYGESESLIGRHIAGRRNEYFLATKCACNLSGSGPSHIFTREQFRKNLTDSLRKLRTDHIDLWQMHCATPPDLPGGRFDDAVRAMRDAKEQGDVGLIGVSFKNGSKGDLDYPIGHQTRYAREMAEWGVFDGIQLVYGALTPESAADIEYIGSLGVGVIARGVLQRYFDFYQHLPAKGKPCRIV
jgi:aryl-alcohol dehydrogenase-like predicted oxidoreductase